MTSQEELARRAREMDLQLKYGKEDTKGSQLDILTKYVQILENKINILNDKVDRLLTVNTKTLNESHERLLEMLYDWKSTANLANELGYRQEHVSRLISDMKKAGIVQERRDGKNIFYKRS